jgi:hypothetical protein
MEDTVDYVDLDDQMESLEKYVSEMPIYSKDYETIKTMIDNMDDTLFVKVMEEIKNGNLTFGDFRRIFANTSYGENIGNSLDNQKRLHDEYKMMIDHINDVVTDTELAAFSSLDNFLKTTQESAVSVEKQQKIYELLMENSDDPYSSIAKAFVIEDFIASGDASTNIEDLFMLSKDDYYIPVDFRYVQLTDQDMRFASDNELTTDQMKKLKSMTALFINQPKDPKKE